MDSMSVQDAGASPLFPPEHATAEDARQALLQTVRAGPADGATRWSLHRLRAHLPWLSLGSDSGLHRLLRRLGIVYKRGRASLHSPDPLYRAKAAYAEDCLMRARAHPQRVVLLYQDEAAYARQPTLSWDYEARGAGDQPRARHTHKSDTKRRIAACLEALSGRVFYQDRAKTGVDALVELYQEVVQAYDTAEQIYLVQDNWPVHFHPGVIRHLEAQHWPFPFLTHPAWPSPGQVPRVSNPLPIQLVPLPSYAPWLNPIEKLWRWLRQEVLHLHRLSDAWAVLRERVCAFLDQFADGSEALLRYVGLLPK